ncbi:MAG: iron ABC transporter permease [Muribaculum sp.]|nr:iron ABC transporter permease [Muribaculum sp.]
MNRRKVWLFSSGVLFLILTLFLLTLFLGSVSIPAADVWNILCGGDGGRESRRYIVMENRLPQAITALLGGGSLAVTGLMLQTAFRNSLAGPGIFGVSSGASLGVALVMLLPGATMGMYSGWGGFLGVTVAAFAGAMVVMGIIMAISLTLRSNVLLLIVGIMIGYLTSSAISLLNFFAGAQSVQSYMVWGLGTFSSVTLSQLPFFTAGCVVGVGASMLLIKPLNIMLLGDNYAINLGVSPVKVRNYLLLITGWLTAVVTAYCGPIAFIGLAVPHIARLTVRTDNHAVLMPATLAWGGVIGLLCNLICVIPSDVGILPLNTVTPLIGAPVIIYVIVSHAKSYS